MPELPEVEYAARVLERATRGRTLTALRVLHPALRRRLPPADSDRLTGRRVERVERRGKHQLVHLDDGSVLHVHFRMAGDWVVGRAGEPVPPYARALLDFDDGTRVALADPRALATVERLALDAQTLPELGPDPTDPGFGAADLYQRLVARRGPIKPALLDQRIVAGLGNIYAAEALWRARISPIVPSARLTAPDARRLLVAIRTVLARATEDPGRYARGEAAARLEVYGRSGEPCRRCRTAIVRIVQAGRSTYYCPGCQTG
jgi:formamidopyrimidine-DNA glycosylase